MRRNLVAVFIVLFLMVVPAAAQDRPKYNVLFIFADDMRAELGCYGGLAKTPNIDALAHSGVLFERAYCQYPLCNPTRSSLLTGHYPIYTGVLNNTANWRTDHPDWVTLPRLFKEHGYASLRTGKIFHGIASLDDPNAWTEGGAAQGGVVEPDGAMADPVGGPIYAMTTAADAPDRNSKEYLLAGSGVNPGQAAQQQHSDHWSATDDGPDGGITGSTRQAISYLNKYKEKPFFLALGYSKPHSPLDTSLRFFQPYDINQIPLPVDYAVRPTLPPGFPQGSIRPRNADLFIGRDSNPDTAKDMIRAYLACMTSVDVNVGIVLAELDRLDLRKNTIIVFWGDHGYQLGEKGKWSKAGSVWEQGARVPTIIYAPGLAGMGKPSSRVVESLDFYRTLSELCDLTPPDHVQGRSLIPLLKDPSATWDHPAYTIWSEDSRNLTAVSVRNEKYRYAEFTAGSGGAMLIDEEKDPHEIKNVVDDPAYAAVKEELHKLVVDYKAKYKPPGQ